MKKTLALLMSVAAAFQAQAKNDAIITHGTNGWTSDNESLVETVTQQSTHTTKTGTTYANSFYAIGGNDVLNIGNGNTYTFSLQFEMEEAYNLTAIQVALASFTGSGGTQVADRYADVTLTLSQVVEGSLTQVVNPITLENIQLAGTGGTTTGNIAFAADYTTGNVTSGSGAVATFDFGSGTGLVQGGTYQIDLAVSKGSDNPAQGGFFLGIGGVRLIPEPTTATLSLLALAGLAARRRRQ